MSLQQASGLAERIRWQKKNAKEIRRVRRIRRWSTYARPLIDLASAILGLFKR